MLLDIDKINGKLEKEEFIKWHRTKIEDTESERYADYIICADWGFYTDELSPKILGTLYARFKEIPQDLTLAAKIDYKSKNDFTTDYVQLSQETQEQWKEVFKITEYVAEDTELNYIKKWRLINTRKGTAAIKSDVEKMINGFGGETILMTENQNGTYLTISQTTNQKKEIYTTRIIKITEHLPELFDVVEVLRCY